MCHISAINALSAYPIAVKVTAWVGLGEDFLSVFRVCMSFKIALSVEAWRFFSLAPNWISMPLIYALWAFQRLKGFSTECALSRKKFWKCCVISAYSKSSCSILVLLRQTGGEEETA